MKMIVAIVPETQLNMILDALVAEQYRATLVSTTGGFFRKGNATLLVGVENERLSNALDCIKNARSRVVNAMEQDIGVAVFVLDVERHVRV